MHVNNAHFKLLTIRLAQWQNKCILKCLLGFKDARNVSKVSLPWKPSAPGRSPLHCSSHSHSGCQYWSTVQPMMTRNEEKCKECVNWHYNNLRHGRKQTPYITGFLQCMWHVQSPLMQPSNHCPGQWGEFQGLPPDSGHSWLRPVHASKTAGWAGEQTHKESF